MAVQLSTAVRNAMLDQIESTISTSPIMKIRTSSVPANCAAADAGTVLATIALPSDWLAAASGGSKAIAGSPWEDTSADASGTAAHFRVYDSGGSTCHIQGTVGVGSGDLQVDSTAFTAGQDFKVTAFTLTAGNA